MKGTCSPVLLSRSILTWLQLVKMLVTNSQQQLHVVQFAKKKKFFKCFFSSSSIFDVHNRDFHLKIQNNFFIKRNSNN